MGVRDLEARMWLAVLAVGGFGAAALVLMRAKHKRFAGGSAMAAALSGLLLLIWSLPRDLSMSEEFLAVGRGEGHLLYLDGSTWVGDAAEPVARFQAVADLASNATISRSSVNDETVVELGVLFGEVVLRKDDDAKWMSLPLNDLLDRIEAVDLPEWEFESAAATQRSPRVKDVKFDRAEAVEFRLSALQSSSSEESPTGTWTRWWRDGAFGR